MNVLLKDKDQSDLIDKTFNVTNQVIVECVTGAMDRGITRIKRNAIVDELIKTVIGYASINSEFTPAGKVVVFDTMACRVSVTFQGKDTYEIIFEGNDELTSKLTIRKANNSLTVNGNVVEFQSLLVMVTSLILKNSQDSGGQIVEVFTKS